MDDPKDDMMSSNPRRIYLFVCTLPDCNDICMSRDKLLDHLEGHKVFETKVIDLADYDNGEEQLTEFVKMIDNGDNNGVISNSDNEPRMKTRNNSKKMQCIFNNCKSTFVDRKEAINHFRKQHLTTLDTSENDLLQVSTKNDVVGGDIEDQPKSDSEHSNMAVDYLKIELLSDTDIDDDDNNGFDNEDDDLTRTPPEDSGKEVPQNEFVESKSPPRDNKESLFMRLWDINKKLLFQCLKCDKCYKYRNTILRHIAIVHEPGLPSSLRDQVSIENNQEPSYCQFEGCPASFATPISLRLHESIVHTKNAVLIRCPWPDCDYASYHQHLIVRHTLVHTSERSFRCEWSDCEKTFKTHSAMSAHTTSHRNERKHRCKWPDCQKAFKTHSALAQHTVSHRNERKYRCKWPGCSHSFNVAGSLRRHVELHERKRPKEMAVDSGQKMSEKPNLMLKKT